MNIGDRVLNEFNELPDRAKSLWFEWTWKCALNDNIAPSFFLLEEGFETTGCKSPIEQIFCLAYKIYSFEKYDSDFSEGLCFERQYKIEAKSGKNYVADFLIHHEFASSESKSVVIECDGHDYHKLTKEQVEHDNDRDFDIKETGYDIIHFSGSQIFKSPMKCAEKAYEYFKSITTLIEPDDSIFTFPCEVEEQ